MKRKVLVSAIVGAALALPLAALADSISPSTFSATLDVGENVTIHKTVTIDTAPPTDAVLDVMFLFDTTGSMGGLINNAKTSASAITTALTAFGDVSFGVAHYEDFPTAPWGGAGDVPFEQVADLGTAGAAQTAINSLSLGWGYDGPESNLYALQQTAQTTSWRADSTRVVVWFGDAPGHDPADTAGYPGPTLAQTIAALTGENVTVVAIDLNNNMDSQGEVTAITGATGGSKTVGLPSAANIADVITGLVTEVFASYDTVTLDVVGDHAGVDVSWTPTAYTGDFDRSVTRTFEFDVTFAGTAPGTYDFAVRALVDGGVVARESDSITVTGGGAPVPEPGTMILLGSGLLGLAGTGRRRSKKA